MKTKKPLELTTKDIELTVQQQIIRTFGKSFKLFVKATPYTKLTNVPPNTRPL